MICTENITLSSHWPCKLCLALGPQAIFSGLMKKILHYCMIALFCSSPVLFSYLFTSSNFLFLSDSMMITQRFCHCDCSRINDTWANTKCLIYLIFCLCWILHPVWERWCFMIDPSEDYKIKFCLDFCCCCCCCGKINSKKFKQVKSQEEKNRTSKEQSKTVCSCTKRQK